MFAASVRPLAVAVPVTLPAQLERRTTGPARCPACVGSAFLAVRQRLSGTVGLLTVRSAGRPADDPFLSASLLIWADGRPARSADTIAAARSRHTNGRFQ